MYNALLHIVNYYSIGPPLLPVNNITVTLINNSALIINWTEQQQCINHYTITITSNDTNTVNNTVNTSAATINDITGTNYSFIIIPIDTIGREGPPSSLIQYIWNGKNHTHTHSLYFL